MYIDYQGIRPVTHITAQVVVVRFPDTKIRIARTARTSALQQTSKDNGNCQDISHLTLTQEAQDVLQLRPPSFRPNAFLGFPE